MHSYNFCAGVDHLTKFLVSGSISRSVSYFLTLTFLLCFGFETAIDLDQYTALCACIMLACIYSFKVPYCSALSSAYLSGLYIHWFSHFNTVTTRFKLRR